MAALSCLVSILILNSNCLTFGCALPNFDPILQWKRIEFQTPSTIPITTILNDVEPYYPPNAKPRRIFLTIPRYDVNNPMTLVELTNATRDGNPIVKAYPDQTWFVDVAKCPKKRLVSVYRTRIDRCGRLWVLDTGYAGVAPIRICNPQIIAFNLTTNKLVHRFEVPVKVLEPRSLLLNLVVDLRDNCDDLFIYIGDSQTYSTIVYDVKNRDIWKITDKTMYPDPKYGTLSVPGTNFELMDGILGIDLVKNYGKDRKLFYSALNSGMMNWALTSNLKDKSRFNRTFLTHPEIFHDYKTKRPGISGPFALDKSGIAYFGQIYDTSLNCWRIDEPDYGNYITTIYRNNVTMQFIVGLKIIVNPSTNEEELWTLAMWLVRGSRGEFLLDQVNFRVFLTPINAIRNYCK